MGVDPTLAGIPVGRTAVKSLQGRLRLPRVAPAFGNVTVLAAADQDVSDRGAARGVVGTWDAEAKAEQASRELVASTGNFTSPTIIRSYENSDVGLRQANVDAAKLARQGYVPAGQAADGGHINVGRTATGAVLTGGISLLFGGSRTKGKVTITYTKRQS